MHKEGSKYGTIVVNLFTGQALAVIPSRDTGVVAKFLEKFTNLTFISRDRAKNYRAVLPEKMHIADTFHLLVNCSNLISKYVNHAIDLKTTREEFERYSLKLTEQQEGRLVVFRHIRKDLENGFSPIQIKELYDLTELQITQCLENNYDFVIRNRIKRGNFDPYKSIIEDLYLKNFDGKQITKILQEQYDFPFKHRAVTNFIQHNIKAEPNPFCRLFTKRKLIQFILKWQEFSEEEITIFKKVIQQHPNLQIFIDFYWSFKKALTKKDFRLCETLLDTQTDIPALSRFISELNRDRNAVLNASRYNFSNGMLEGSVNKLKVFKKTMFGRASVALLNLKFLFS